MKSNVPYFKYIQSPSATLNKMDRQVKQKKASYIKKKGLLLKFSNVDFLVHKYVHKHMNGI